MKRKYQHFDDIFITVRTESTANDETIKITIFLLPWTLLLQSSSF